MATFDTEHLKINCYGNQNLSFQNPEAPKLAEKTDPCSQMLFYTFEPIREILVTNMIGSQPMFRRSRAPLRAHAQDIENDGGSDQNVDL